MSHVDPYAPPSSDFHPGTSDFEVVGDKIHSYSPLVLPVDLCVKCGAEGDHGVTKTKKLYYTPWWVALTILISWIITIILHFVLRKRLDATYHVCETCDGKRKKKIWGSVGTLVVTLVLFFVGVGNDHPVLLFVGGAGFVIALIALIIFAMPAIRPKSFNAGLFVVQGADPTFLQRLQRTDQMDPLTASDREVDGATW